MKGGVEMIATISRKAKSQMVVKGLVAPIATIILMLLIAGRWNYWQAWVFMGVTMMVLVVNLLTMLRDPDFISERLAPGEGQKKWDKLYFAITTPLYLVTLILGGLDAGRFHWSPNFSWWVYAITLLVYLLGWGIFQWAKTTNRYFSSVVRIQTDRSQAVCREGPYKIVRHPGYVGGMIFTILTPILLGSLWGLIPQGIAIILMVIRTKLEDDTLQRELPGYTDYVEKVKYRLLPGVW
jgi:protein-S-isoprenylcysteine O-methyltransferase Ste14